MVAVTVELPDLVLLNVVVAMPFPFVVTWTDVTMAPLVALKVTISSETGLPKALVTIACTSLVATPLATASLLIVVRAPLAIVAIFPIIAVAGAIFTF